MRKARERRRLIDRLVGELGLPIPADPDSLFTALIATASEMRGREIELLKEEFPHQTESGLWLELPSRDLIIVDNRAAPLHQLAILFHELWHLFMGGCGHHVDGKAVAARMLSKRADIHDAVQVAARTEFNELEEKDAEKFALQAVTQVRVWLEGTPDGASTDRDQIAGRIGASLGHRRPQV